MTDLEREHLLLTVPEITFEVAVIVNEILYMLFFCLFCCWHNTCNNDQITWACHTAVNISIKESDASPHLLKVVM